MADLNVAIKLAVVGGSAAASGIGAVGTALGHLGAAATSPVKALGGLGAALGSIGMASIGFGALVSGVAGVASGMVSGNAEMETYEAQLGTLLGSADKAREQLAKLAKFGAETPFELPEIVRAEKVLLGFGLTGDKVFKLTGKTADQFRTVVGDVAAGTGANFEEIALTFGKFSAGATGEAISRFQELGVATREQMAGMGIEFSKSGELLSPLPVAMAAIVKISQEKFGGGMDKLSKTTNGQLSTLADNFNQAKNKITTSIFTAFGGVVASVNELFGQVDVQAGIQRVADVLAGLVQGGVALAIDAFGRLQATFTAILPTLQSIYERVTTFFGALTTGQTLAASVNKAFGDLIPAGLNPLLDAVDRAFGAVKTTIAGLVSTFQQGGLAGLWAGVTTAMADFAPTGERIRGALSAIGTAIAAIVPEPIKSFVAGLLDTATGASNGEGPLKVLAGVVNLVSGALEGAIRFVKENIVVQAALVAILAGAATAWGISLAIQAYSTAVGIARAAVAAFTAVQAALNLVLTLNPIGLVVVALAALAAALIYAYNNSETFRDVVDKAFAVLKTVTMNAIETASTLLTGLGQLIEDVGQTIADWRVTITTAFNGVRTAVTTATNTTRGVIEAGWALITGAIGAALAAIGTAVDAGWAAVEAATSAITATVVQVVTDAWLLIKTNILTPLAEVLAKMQETWTAVHTAVSAAVATALAAVVAFGVALIKEIEGRIAETKAQAMALGQSIVDGIREAINGAWNALTEWFRAKVQALIDTAKAVIKPGSPSKAFFDIGLTIPQGLKAGIESTAAVAIAAVRRVAQQVADAAANLGPQWHRIGGGLIARFSDGIVDNTATVLTAIAQMGEQGKAALEALKRWIGDAHSGWIGEVAAKRTELLRLFNYAAFLRGEGLKVLPELQDLTNTYVDNVSHAIASAVSQLQKLATDYQAAVLAARAEAAKQVLQVIGEADTRVAELVEQRSLSRRLQQQKDAFAGMMRLQADHFKAQQAQLEDALRGQEQIYRIAFQAQLKSGRVGTDAAPGVTAAQQALDTQTELLRIGFEQSRDLGRAATDAEKAEINARAAEARTALDDRLAEEAYLATATKELRLTLQREQIAAEKAQALQALLDQQAEELYVREHTSVLRTQIAMREAAMAALVAEQERVFEDKLDAEAFARQVAQIYAERDARITAINVALAEKEVALAASLEKERQAILDNLAKELADLQREYIAKVVEAFHHAQVDISDFIGTINDDLKRQTQAVADQVLALIGQIRDAKQGIGDTPVYGTAPVPYLPDTTPRGSNAPAPYKGPGTALDPVLKTGNTYNLTIQPQTMDLSEADVARLFKRMELMAQ